MRFRIRSLMVLTAVVAVACSVIPWIVASDFQPVAMVVLVSFVSIGPLIGSIRAGRRFKQEGDLDPIMGGVTGGMVQATVLTFLLALLLLGSALRSGTSELSGFAGFLLIGWLILAGIHTVSGMLVGVVFCLWFAVRIPAREEKRIEDKQG